jgi:hypothetical protein
MNWAALAIALFLATGCATRAPFAWRLEGQTIVPPGRARPIAVKTRGECPSGDAIVAHRRGGRVVLEVNRETLSGTRDGWLADWAGRAEQNGCVPAGEGNALAVRVLDTVPLGLARRYQLMHPNHARSGFVDLGPENRLEVITPILREGAVENGGALRQTSVEAAPRGLAVTVESAPDLLGVETAWYQPRAGAIEPLGTIPRHNLFAGMQARYWWLVYKADQSSVVVAADSWRELEEITAAGSCQKCVGVPRSVAVNPYVAVMVNGSEVRAPVGSTLEGVIRAAGGKPAEVLGTLVVTKRFEGRMLPVVFAHTTPQVLSLVMEGNETVRW